MDQQFIVYYGSTVFSLWMNSIFNTDQQFIVYSLHKNVLSIFDDEIFSFKNQCVCLILRAKKYKIALYSPHLFVARTTFLF